ncbi:MAG: DUF6516 family protein [Zoogloeaceae bacterium]|nr:DUF6516 family protein [Zoogloeaceae bacterium]
MKAELLVDRRVTLTVDAFIEMKLWRLPEPIPGSAHFFKYSLAYVVKGVCVLRYDNERGKGDHRHDGNVESRITFHNPDQLMNDFLADVTRWNHENYHS